MVPIVVELTLCLIDGGVFGNVGLLVVIEVEVAVGLGVADVELVAPEHGQVAVIVRASVQHGCGSNQMNGQFSLFRLYGLRFELADRLSDLGLRVANLVGLVKDDTAEFAHQAGIVLLGPVQCVAGRRVFVIQFLAVVVAVMVIIIAIGGLGRGERDRFYYRRGQ